MFYMSYVKNFNFLKIVRLHFILQQFELGNNFLINVKFVYYSRDLVRDRHIERRSGSTLTEL